MELDICLARIHLTPPPELTGLATEQGCIWRVSPKLEGFWPPILIVDAWLSFITGHGINEIGHIYTLIRYLTQIHPGSYVPMCSDTTLEKLRICANSFEKNIAYAIQNYKSTKKEEDYNTLIELVHQALRNLMLILGNAGLTNLRTIDEINTLWKC